MVYKPTPSILIENIKFYVWENYHEHFKSKCSIEKKISSAGYHQENPFYENRTLKKENEKLSSQVEELEDKIYQLESQKNPFEYSFFDIWVYLSHRLYQMYTVKLSQLGLTDWNKLFIVKL